MASRDESTIREIRQPGPYEYVYGHHANPIAVVKPGETVRIFTEDAFHSTITTESDSPSRVLPAHPNPQTGPILVEGAQPGDTLLVDIVAVEPTRSWAASAMVPHFGGLTSTTQTRSLQEPLPERVWIYHLDDNVYHCGTRLKVPLKPFVGTMGTSPELEAISSQTPGTHGGNMDVPDMCPGNRACFPVAVEGAYFFVGDCHGAQGHGELGGSALEITACVTLRFELLQGQTISWPRIESPYELMVVGSARPMEDAAKIAYAELVQWLERDYRYERWDAYQLLTQLGRLTVGNMVDPNYSLIAAIEKRWLTVVE